jgi:site-specific recombinase XerD
MSTKTASLASPANLAEVMERILSLGGLQRQRRDDLMSAVRQVARLIGGLPADIPANPEALRRGLNALTPASAGMTKRRWGNVRALLAAALDLTGAKIVSQRRKVDLTPSWSSLWNRVGNKYARWRLSRFFTFASEKGVEPDQVSNRTVADFEETLKRNSLLTGQTRIIRDLCREWNRCAASIENWPATRLSAPDRRRPYALPASAYPPSFAADVAAYLEHQARGDLFGGSGYGPASPMTIRSLRLQLFQMAAALVQSGRDPQTIRSLADLVEPEAVKTALSFFWKRNGGRKTTQLHGFALTGIKIGKYWTKAPPERIAALQKIRREVDPKETGMTARNRARLRQFDDPENVRRLIDLPQAIVRELPRQGPPSHAQALRVQSALGIAILLAAPMRAKNLASLQLCRHVVQTRPGGVRHIVIPAEEVKNRAPLAFVVSDTLGAVMDVYLARCRPLLAGDPEGFLFPARKGGVKTPGTLADQIKRTIWQETGLDLNVHCFRHLAALLLLRAHPGEYETTRLLLGHKDISTTTQFYCGLEQADALRRYDALIDSYRRKEAA